MNPPSVSAVIVASPAPIALTVTVDPLPSAFATSALVLVHVTLPGSMPRGMVTRATSSEAPSLRLIES